MNHTFTNSGSSTLTSNITGGVSCVGDVISFTCTNDPPEELLEWTITITGEASVTSLALFNFAAQPPDEITLPDDFIGRATLIFTSPTVVSSLTLTATTQLDGAMVQCAGVTTVDSAVITIASMLCCMCKQYMYPSSPRSSFPSTECDGDHCSEWNYHCHC